MQQWCGAWHWGGSLLAPHGVVRAAAMQSILIFYLLNFFCHCCCRSANVELCLYLLALGILCAFYVQSSHEEERAQAMHQHKVERRKIRRSAGEISKTFKDKPKFWMGQRVNTK